MRRRRLHRPVWPVAGSALGKDERTPRGKFVSIQRACISSLQADAVRPCRSVLGSLPTTALTSRCRTRAGPPWAAPAPYTPTATSPGAQQRQHQGSPLPNRPPRRAGHGTTLRIALARVCAWHVRDARRRADVVCLAPDLADRGREQPSSDRQSQRHYDRKRPKRPYQGAPSSLCTPHAQLDASRPSLRTMLYASSD
jgi:hypothetical protein